MLFRKAKALKDLCEARVGILKKLSFEQLSKLQSTHETPEICGKKGNMNLIFEKHGEGELMVVVQGDVPTFLIGRHWHVGGFVVQPDGNKRELTDEEVLFYD